MVLIYILVRNGHMIINLIKRFFERVTKIVLFVLNQCIGFVVGYSAEVGVVT